MSVYLEHANITVKIIDKSVEFIQTALPDFKIRSQGVSGGKRWLHIGTELLYLTLNESLSGEGTVIEKSYVNSGLNNLAFVVDDLDSIDKRLQADDYTSDTVFQEESDIAVDITMKMLMVWRWSLFSI